MEPGITAAAALEKLRAGNENYLRQSTGSGDISPEIRRRTYLHGQHPYAIVLTCSDSRVIPESIFDAGIGDLFVIRVAGNVVDNHQLGSIEYAAGHLGTQLIVVLGHTHCGAVEAAIHHEPSGYIKYLTDEIRSAIGGEKDDYRACCLNVEHALQKIQHSLAVHHISAQRDPAVVGAVYDIETGKVTFLEGAL